jgi:hypothetical protein
MPKRKSLWRGTEVPQRLHFQTLGVAIFHGHLKKVRVMSKVYRKTEYVRIRRSIGLPGLNVQPFICLI